MSSFGPTPRVQPGVPTGGQFAARQHDESDVVLEAPPGDVHSSVREMNEAYMGWARAQNDADTAQRALDAANARTQAAYGEFQAKIEALRGVAPELATDALVQAHHDQEQAGCRSWAEDFRTSPAYDLPPAFNYGSTPPLDPPVPDIGYPAWPASSGDAPYSADRFGPNGRAAASDTAAEDNYSDSSGKTIYRSTGYSAQHGQVLDRVEHDGIVFHRRRDGVYPGTPYAMRFQASRPLTEDEIGQAAGLVGYAYRAEVRGESMPAPERDTPYSFVVHADTTKSQSDDLGIALEDFERTLPTMLNEGSPVRKTDRSGAGTKGTRLVDGFNDPALRFEVFYDDVHESGSSRP